MASPPPSPVRYQLAIDSLDKDASLHELAFMLLQACEEAVAEGKHPETDPAVALISGRIGFASPVDVMSRDSWERLVEVCATQNTDATLQLIDGSLQ